MRNTKCTEQEITSLVGETSYEVLKRPCRGKYRGYKDYFLKFGSGRELFICVGAANYPQKLQEHFEQLRWFTDHRKENEERFRALQNVEGAATAFKFDDCTVEISPSRLDPRTLHLYAKIVLHIGDERYPIESTRVHCFLTGCQAEWCSFEHCAAELLGKEYPIYEH